MTGRIHSTEKKHDRAQGFTLIEIILDIAFIAIIFSLSVPLYQSYYARGQLNTAVETFSHALYRAQSFAMMGKSDAAWGVKVNTSSIVVFAGQNYQSRDVDQDEISDISSNLAVSGVREIVFSKLNGIPDVYGTSTFETANMSEERTITVTPLGIVNY